MPNYLLCNQFHVRVSVLVHICTVSSDVKRAWFKSKRYVSFVLCVGLFGFVSYAVPCRILG